MSNTAQTPEAVALRLLDTIALNEKKYAVDKFTSIVIKADRDWILQTYAECLLTIQKPSDRIKS